MTPTEQKIIELLNTQDATAPEIMRAISASDGAVYYSLHALEAIGEVAKLPSVTGRTDIWTRGSVLRQQKMRRAMVCKPWKRGVVA